MCALCESIIDGVGQVPVISFSLDELEGGLNYVPRKINKGKTSTLVSTFRDNTKLGSRG